MSGGPGASLLTLRKLAGLTLADAAKRADTTETFLSKVEADCINFTATYSRKVTSVYAAALAEAGAAQ